MKVLMVTPRVDELHPILGFIPTWINNLAKRVKILHVLTLGYNEKTYLLDNVIVHSLDRRKNKLGKIIYFNNTMLKLRKKVDVVFCHMYPDLAALSALYGRLLGIPVVWFRAHGSINLTARIAYFLVSRVVTSSEQGFKIKGNKVIIIGQGIDTNKFKPADRPERENKVILAVGRISPIKNYETLIKAANILINEKKMKNLSFVIVGGVPVASQRGYFERLKKMVKEFKLEGYIEFIGPMSYGDIVSYYQNCDIFVNPSHASSLEKTVLEAMACEKPVITSNIAYYLDVFDEELRKKCYFEKNDYKALADRIEYFLNNDETSLKKKLREIVVQHHSVEHLMDSLVNIFKEVTT